MESELKGVLLMAYGTPDTLEDVEPYYTHIRHGHSPSPERLAELRQRYALVGGQTPLSRISEETRSRLENALNEDAGQYVVALGMKHWRPWIRDAVESLVNRGARRAVGLVLAPHYSTMSIAEYQGYAEKARSDLRADMQIDMVQSWHLHRGYLDAVARRVREALRGFADRRRVTVIFTAHSLPERILQADDPYPRQLQETSQALADMLGVDDWTFSFQSAGRTEEKWLGPDLLETIEELGARGVENILVAPIGFVSDHLEILYDIDYEARRAAQDRGITLKRTQSLNAEPDFIEALADIVRSRASELNQER